MKRNLLSLFGSVAVLLGAQTSGAQQSPTNDPMIQQQDRAEEEEDFLNTLD
jgi:hypothetical protein